MKRSFRILGALMLLPYLLIIAWCVYALAFSGGKADSGTRILAFCFLIPIVVPAVFFASGLAGRPLDKRYPKLAGALTVICGAAMFMLDPGYSAAPLTLIVAGVLVIASSEVNDNPRQTKTPTAK